MAATALAQVSMQNAPQSEPMRFGSYAPMPAFGPAVSNTLGKMPLPVPANDTFRGRRGAEPSKILSAANENSAASNPLGFSDKDNLWLKELGIASTSPGNVKKVWTANEHLYKPRAWSDSYGGRIAIRTFSRGILGAAFFAAGQQILASPKFGLSNYSYRYGSKEGQDKTKTLLDKFARGLDRTLGEGIRWGYGQVTGSPEKGIQAVTFRGTRTYNNAKLENGKINVPLAGKQPELALGRSYGEEALSITFDFGMASLGDHMGRDLAAVVDPNIEKTWIKNGHIDLPKAALAIVKSVSTGLFRAMGEDYFAMAFGYPYVVRASRNVINHFSPGFNYDSDNALNGGSTKHSTRNLFVDGQPVLNAKNEHITEPKMIGNYQMEGMLDLGFRFTVYNWLTKIFRDTYDWTLDKTNRAIHHDKSLHFGHDLLNAVIKIPHNIVRDIVKTTIIMVPSMPFFFMFRSPQSKDVGLAINTDIDKNGKDIVGPIGIEDRNGRFWPIAANGRFRSSKRSELHSQEVIHRSSVYKNGNEVFHDINNFKQYDELEFKGFIPDRKNGFEQRYNPYGTNVVWHDGITNFIGRSCYQASQIVTEGLKKGLHGLGFKVTNARISDFSRRMVYASAAYTPYFAMKTDVLTAAYDTPRMNMSIDRAIYGAVHLSAHEFSAGLGEIGRTILGKPFTEKDREFKARRSLRALEESLAPGEGEQNSAIKQRDNGPKSFTNDSLRRKPLTAVAAKDPSVNWQKTVKQFKELQPDGQAIN